MNPPSEVKHVVLFAALAPGTLILAECADGSLRLLRDDTPLDGCHWPHDQLKEAAATFHRLAAEARREN
jgi:hypothetical protein